MVDEEEASSSGSEDSDDEGVMASIYSIGSSSRDVASGSGSSGSSSNGSRDGSGDASGLPHSNGHMAFKHASALPAEHQSGLAARGPRDGGDAVGEGRGAPMYGPGSGSSSITFTSGNSAAPRQQGTLTFDPAGSVLDSATGSFDG